MAVLSTTNPTLADVAKRYDADGKIDTIVELLSETNEVLEDMTFLEGNLPTGHKTTVRSGLPSSTWRKLNYGVQPSKSTTVQITDTAGMLEAYAEVDKALADLNGNTASFRGDNIIVGGGSGSDNTSIWLVCWGPNTCHGIYPKGSQAGLKHADLGEVTLEDAASGKYQGYRTHYKWDIGMSLRDWRYVVRIPNIDVSNLNKDASSSSAALVDLMVQAVEKLPNVNLGRCVFYGNRTISSILRRQITNTSNVRLSMDEVAGKRVMSFDGIPFRRNDAILNTEAVVA